MSMFNLNISNKPLVSNEQLKIITIKIARDKFYRRPIRENLLQDLRPLQKSWVIDSANRYSYRWRHSIPPGIPPQYQVAPYLDESNTLGGRRKSRKHRSRKHRKTRRHH